MNILNFRTGLSIRETRAAFLNLLCTPILPIPGRINGVNLERSSFVILTGLGRYRHEKPFRIWAEKPSVFWFSRLRTSGLVRS
jgi:hypothetical protein